ncbi:pleckstrin-like [Saccostrea cucullata]|uniref:pleckstrin-like n=1 Tax=Saccostrea cuccullata TaxID=36930 RepID=UPI002ED4A43F
MEDGTSLKTGFLLRYEPSKRWKLRWFALLEEQLVCTHKLHHSMVVDIIPLEGASVVCPITDPQLNTPNNTHSFCGTFKITTPGGDELFFQAAGKHDRDMWAHAVGAVIRALSGSKQDSQQPIPFTSFRATANVTEILGAMQDPDAGVNLGSHVRNGAVHKNCFTGSAVVDWLVRWSIIRKRDDGSAMIQTLLKLGHVQEVDINDGALGASKKFSDGDKLYRFSSLNLGAKRNSYYDSTDSETSSSEDEEDETQENKLRKGKVLKASFLAKKKSIRKDWRIVRVTLRENPPSIEYSRVLHDHTKRGKIIDVEEVNTEEAKNDCLACGQDAAETARLKKRIVLKDRKGKCYIFKTKDEQEKLEWLPLLQSLSRKASAAQ